ncbi:1,4-alpha-glucan branching protein GlgB [Paenibacillus senegalensis]|uniref:1,4-alpha-glucan branching protein GlgB n=1 Tax=Paenibacillus senegalensis TaxID=1465766 RepID=UPI0002890678|nr:1,4-alpha-glucan branching protein GlgB [Paenibacillus senegalensis]
MNKLAERSSDLYLFHEGKLHHSYRLLGAHLAEVDDLHGVQFAVWAPNARSVKVVGDFNGWEGSQHVMQRSSELGVWSLFIPGLEQGTLYKYEIETPQGEKQLKADPYAFYSELRPNTASIVWSLDGYKWNDRAWYMQKKRRPSYHRPMMIYEVHLGTWKLRENGTYMSYEELADELIDYVVDMGYTHIEILPLAEHPFDRSWGYQITGYYSLTSRYGTPQQFMYFVDRCHQRGIGVILDWVPGHFCKDAHGLRTFDGTPLYEYADWRKAEKPLWGTLSFDFGRPEVMSFLISNAIFWMDCYHIDGLRVDAVASMLDLNFDKPASMWTLNQHGGTDNLEAIQFIRSLNEAVFHHYPDALMIAEDSSARPRVTAPTYEDGLGFNYKWNMGWMNDMLAYMKLPPEERRHHHQLITFSLFYAFSENYVLPLSHDEVVHGKKSLLDKMPGDYWSKFANLRLLYTYLMTHPGKKLVFMGGELGHFAEWKDLEQIDWFLLDYDMHRAMHKFVKTLNLLYQNEKALWQNDHQWGGFEWIDADNAEQSVISFVRKGRQKKDELLIVCNFTAEAYPSYRIGVPSRGCYREILNSDLRDYGGSGLYNGLDLQAQKEPWHQRPYSIEMTVPPLGAVILKRVPQQRKGQRAQGTRVIQERRKV